MNPTEERACHGIKTYATSLEDNQTERLYRNESKELHAFLTQELFALKQMKDFEAEQLLGSDGIDREHRQPPRSVLPQSRLGWEPGYY